MRLDSINIARPVDEHLVTLFYQASHDLSDADQKPMVSENAHIDDNFILRARQCLMCYNSNFKATDFKESP